MGFGDISARMKKLGGQGDAPEEKPYDSEASYHLRGKMLGVLIQDARLHSARTIEDCARLLHVAPEEIAAWEYGDRTPSLPQIEVLAYYLGVPVSHFWGQETIGDDKSNAQSSQSEYIKLRDRMIGALLRSAREEAELSIEDVSEATYIATDLLQHYELGELSIPMHHLSTLSSAVNKNISYFVETSGYIGELLQIREEWKKFTDMDDNLREFASNPSNLGFIQIAVMFSKMPTDDLRKIAEGLLEITM